MNGEVIGGLEVNGEKFIQVQLENGSQMRLPFTEGLGQQLAINWEELVAVAGDTVQQVPEDRNCLNSSNNQGKKIWRKDEMKLLINSYKEEKEKFKNTSFKNDAVWEIISQKMKRNGFDVSGSQCKFKFQQLKKKYTSAKDNNKKTGAAPIIFTFMDEFEELFSREHIVCPAAVAESMQYTPMPSTSAAVLEENRGVTQNEGETDDSSLTATRRRLPINRMLLEEFQLYREEKALREIERKEERNADRDERRRQHDENITVMRQAVETYKEMTSKLLDKL